jgi:hypothetical protein
MLGAEKAAKANEKFEQGYNAIFEDAEYSFSVETISVSIKQGYINELTWHEEPTPEEVMAAINHTIEGWCELVQSRSDALKKTLINQVIEGVPVTSQNELLKQLTFSVCQSQ